MIHYFCYKLFINLLCFFFLTLEVNSSQNRRLSISHDLVTPTSVINDELYTGPTRYPISGKINSVVDFSVGDHATLIIEYHSSNTWPFGFQESYSIWGMGWNQHGIFGNGTTTDETKLTRLVDGNMRKVSAGYFHSMFLDTDGSLWTTGFNAFGGLGDGTTTDRHEPRKIVSSGVVEISAGVGHSLFLKENGSLWSVGRNDYGQLGTGTNINQTTSLMIVSSDVVEIDAGAFHNVFVKSDGSLWAFGSNENGALGDGSKINRAFPIKIVSAGVVTANAGSRSTVFVKEDGSLWGMGINEFGQLGNGTTSDIYIPVKIVESGVLDASAGDSHILFIKTDGSLWGIGNNESGQLGLGHKISQNKPIKIIESGVVRAVAGHNYNSIYMLDDGSLWGMGGDYFGKLGFGDTGEIVTPRKMADSNWPQTFLVTVNESSGGSVDGGGKKIIYSRAILEAIPEKGYIFKSWGKDVNSSLNPLNLKLSKDITLTASFEKDMADDDGDGLTNYEELVTFDTNHTSADTDGDSLSDKEELDQSWDPKTSDKNVIDDVMQMKGVSPEDMTPFVHGWFYSPSMGWLWTNRETFPYIYDSNSKSWMYFQTGNEKPRFYHYGSKSWIVSD
jgi:alpha-tubulin suppressor-like RCC1 family protein